jgi:hypothetical protein
MTRRMRVSPLILLAALNWSTPAGGASGTAPQSRPSAEPPQRKYWCLAKCDEQEATCIAFERRYPSCSPNDICLDEKIQCSAECRLTSQRLGPVQHATAPHPVLGMCRISRTQTRPPMARCRFRAYPGAPPCQAALREKRTGRRGAPDRPVAECPSCETGGPSGFSRS